MAISGMTINSTLQAQSAPDLPSHDGRKVMEAAKLERRAEEDFDGVYFKAEAGITAAVGREGSWVKNDKGVALHLTSKSKGLALSIGVEGLKISM
jgi:hypothetical protein